MSEFDAKAQWEKIVAQMPPSLLSSPISPEQQAEIDRQAQQIEKYRTMLDLFLKAYQRRFFTLESLARQVDKLAIDFSERGRHEWIGYAVALALAVDPEPKKKGRPPIPPEFIDLVAELVEAVNKCEGAPIVANTKNGKTAFDRVAEIFGEARYKISASQAQEWYERRPKRPGKVD
ncbi:hypothetical protein [Ralstonia pseudosolanacearum]|uniref:hypothetical protein n=1 Tax=Ralstonia pseudosolanacearum TaxID=1310165 RepID=UPI0018CFF42F|nr:hypothetical protein [Ralstonia pseudosolanacearum]